MLIDELHHLADLSQNGLTPQRRGQHFEKWLGNLLGQANLSPRTAYRPKGEEIDGSFIYHGRVFLIEAKWWSDPLPASAIYQFKGKVDGKLLGTIGVFISMSAYSDDAVDALRVGKALNIILCDRDDVFAAAEDGFSRVLEFKLRAATELGEIFVPYRRDSERGKLAIIVEGPRDKAIVDAVARHLEQKGETVRQYTVLVAMGQVGLSHVASVTALTDEGDVLVLADDDGVRSDIWGDAQLRGRKLDVIQVDPGVEKWVGLADHREAQRAGLRGVLARANQTDFDALARTDEEFRRFLELLKKKTG